MSLDPVGPSSSHSPLPSSGSGSFNASTNPFGGLKPLDPSDPWYKFFQKLFPNASPSELATGSAAFEKNMFKMLEDQMKKERAKEHEEAEKRKRLFLGEE